MSRHIVIPSRMLQYMTKNTDWLFNKPVLYSMLPNIHFPIYARSQMTQPSDHLCIYVVGNDSVPNHDLYNPIT